MSERSDSNDPWAPPESRQPEPSPYQPPTAPGVHDQPTMTSVPGELPPPPMAPGTYGYPAPAPPAASYGYPGYPGYSAYGQSGWQQAPANGMGITALVLGIISVVLFCAWGLGVVLGILALIFGIIGRKKANRGEANNHGMALAGIILGAVGIVIGGTVLAFIIWTVATEAGRDAYDDNSDNDPFGTSLTVPR
ncbi:DUF4190 domain-containing protein [Streptomyces ficellus]|uniref:DUF4190 domain-containing protein n=1 Tax=Streptomyces ficellus TaxID=1977088 RepID=A0A6I6FP68_9ACTN|nr:DUF4190 domain-containing protein [Streptomyces ficellus]QGV78226.1 DUF4190 domain-containing protein [Streptomyces ficellus]